MTSTAVELPACRNSIQNQNVLLNLEIFLKEELWLSFSVMLLICNYASWWFPSVLYSEWWLSLLDKAWSTAPAPGALILTPPIVDVGFDVDDVDDVDEVDDVVNIVDVDDVEAKCCRVCRGCTHFDATREKFWPSGGNTTLPLTWILHQGRYSSSRISYLQILRHI